MKISINVSKLLGVVSIAGLLLSLGNLEAASRGASLLSKLGQRLAIESAKEGVPSAQSRQVLFGVKPEARAQSRESEEPGKSESAQASSSSATAGSSSGWTMPGWAVPGRAPGWVGWGQQNKELGKLVREFAPRGGGLGKTPWFESSEKQNVPAEGQAQRVEKEELSSPESVKQQEQPVEEAKEASRDRLWQDRPFITRVSEDGGSEQVVPGSSIIEKNIRRGLFGRTLPETPQSPAIEPSAPLTISKGIQLQESVLASPVEPVQVQQPMVPASTAKSSVGPVVKSSSYVSRIKEGALAPFVPVGIRNVIHRQKFKELNAAGIPKGKQRQSVRAIDYDAISRGLFEQIVSSEKPTMMPPTTFLPLPQQETSLVSRVVTEQEVPVQAASSALVPRSSQSSVTVIANKPVTEEFMAEAQSGEIVPNFIVQYRPGQQGLAGELVIASQDQQIQLDLNVFNTEHLQPQLRRMLAGLVKKNEPVTLALYPEQRRLMQAGTSVQGSQALVPIRADAQSSPENIMNQVVDMFSNNETIVLRFEAHEQAASSALPLSSEQTQKLIQQSPQAASSGSQRTYDQQRAVERKDVQQIIKREERPAQRRQRDLSRQEQQLNRQRAATQAFENSQRRDEAARLQAEQAEMSRNQESIADLQPLHEEELVRSQEQSVAPQERQTSQQRSGSQESLLARKNAEQLERNRMERIRLRKEAREALNFRAQENAERAQAASSQRFQDTLRRNALEDMMRQGASSSQAPGSSRVFEEFESAQTAQGPTTTRVFPDETSGTPPVQTQAPDASASGAASSSSRASSTGTAPQADLPTGMPPFVSSPAAGLPGGASQDTQAPAGSSGSTGPTQTTTGGAPAAGQAPSNTGVSGETGQTDGSSQTGPAGSSGSTGPTQTTAGGAPTAGQAPGNAGASGGTEPTGDSSQTGTEPTADADVDADTSAGSSDGSQQSRPGRDPDLARMARELLQTPINRHRLAILAAMHENLPVARNIVDDFYVYSRTINDMLLLYNRHVLHCHAIRTWANQAKTEADAVLAKIKTNIRQLLDRLALTVDAQP